MGIKYVFDDLSNLLLLEQLKTQRTAMCMSEQKVMVVLAAALVDDFWLSHRGSQLSFLSQFVLSDK